ncbi:hypothetical protein EV426DRAFT_581201 [Tirmania nivea]|nr:hypothetical protein EV426DRAFT_581201 [Tirmania nivea]
MTRAIRSDRHRIAFVCIKVEIRFRLLGALMISGSGSFSFSFPSFPPSHRSYNTPIFILFLFVIVSFLNLDGGASKRGAGVSSSICIGISSFKSDVL